MHFHGHFELEPITVNVLDESSEVSLSLAMHTSPYPSGSTMLPISGFPRRIMADVASEVSTPMGPGRSALGMHKAPSKSSLRSMVPPAPISPASPPPPYLKERAASVRGQNPKHSPILSQHEEDGGGGEVAEGRSAFPNYSGKIAPAYKHRNGFVLGQPPRRVRN